MFLMGVGCYIIFTSPSKHLWGSWLPSQWSYSINQRWFHILPYKLHASHEGRSCGTQNSNYFWIHWIHTRVHQIVLCLLYLLTLSVLCYSFTEWHKEILGLHANPWQVKHSWMVPHPSTHIHTHTHKEVKQFTGKLSKPIFSEWVNTWNQLRVG